MFIIQRIYTGKICIQSFKYLCLLLPGGHFFPNLKTKVYSISFTKSKPIQLNQVTSCRKMVKKRTSQIKLSILV